MLYLKYFDDIIFTLFFNSFTIFVKLGILNENFLKKMVIIIYIKANIIYLYLYNMYFCIINYMQFMIILNFKFISFLFLLFSSFNYFRYLSLPLNKVVFSLVPIKIEIFFSKNINKENISIKPDNFFISNIAFI